MHRFPTIASVLGEELSLLCEMDITSLSDIEKAYGPDAMELFGMRHEKFYETVTLPARRPGLSPFRRD